MVCIEGKQAAHATRSLTRFDNMQDCFTGRSGFLQCVQEGEGLAKLGEGGERGGEGEAARQSAREAAVSAVSDRRTTFLSEGTLRPGHYCLFISTVV